MYKGTKKQGPQFAFVMFFFKREKQIFYTAVINVKFLIAFLSSSGFKDPTFMLENVCLEAVVRRCSMKRCY